MESNIPPEYGVCDHPIQFAKRFPTFKGKVWFAPVYRSNQPVSGGWRWRKWGPYVGKEQIQNLEYLFEANGKEGKPLIHVQYLFQLDNRNNKEISDVLGLDPYVLYMVKNGQAKEDEGIEKMLKL